MIITHAWSLSPDGETPALAAALSGKAAALFAVLAGVGVAFATDRPLRERGIGAGMLTVAGRAVALIVVGLTLGLVSSFAVVILVYYGVALLVLAFMVRWSPRALIIVAGVWAAVWPVLSQWLRGSGLIGSELDEASLNLGSASWLSLGDPVTFLYGLTINGHYPALTWLVYLIVGLATGRLLQEARRSGTIKPFAVRTVLTGGLLAGIAFLVAMGTAFGLDAIGSLQEDFSVPASTAQDMFFNRAAGVTGTGSGWFLLAPSPHSGSLIDLAITTGIALTVIGGLLSATDALSSGARKWVAPLAAAGAAPLTIYGAHILTLSVVAITAATVQDRSAGWLLSSPQLAALHILGAVLIGLLLSAIHRRGPLETFVTWAGTMAARLARPRIRH